MFGSYTELQRARSLLSILKKALGFPHLRIQQGMPRPAAPRGQT